MGNKYTIFVGLAFALIACSSDDKADAYGNFEATTITISAKGNGELLYFDVEEGDIKQKGVNVGLIDTTQLYLKKMELKVTLASLNDKLQEAAPEIAVLLEKKSNLTRERNRIQKLYDQKAATQKQLDDYNGELDVVNQQIASTKKQISVANRGVLSQRLPISAQIEALDNNIQDYVINNPINGTILTKIREKHEFVTIGMPLYRIADLSKLKLRAYTSATFLEDVQLNQEVTVRIDDGKDGYSQLKGTVTWISSEAEFTPKTIETKEERINLVYALDVEVVNPGILKIGMPGEVIFNAAE
ncbi:HlyD family efflux transporter periplasmic adaptor subunit [Galbibacter sp. BG1]|uniref:HlyD family secretion protein n=1 Tax=Galbibacter sp. BG1 TaxID=1170699 RepID=UPI0015B81508|nr:HlyD family efflux transporter periplasmic adaptor subunit [Galbibacter sp. BG1]QLE00040.1 HlyD family efflux transporter periplasmic adaptor subunit [Galbibacter sp. BG1]